jgi:hypothetical protein
MTTIRAAAVATAALLSTSFTFSERPQAPATAPLTAHAIIGRHLAARGYGRYRNVATLRVTGTLASGGRTVPLIVLRQRPYLLRQEAHFETGVVVTAYDGQRAWTVDPILGDGTPQLLTGVRAADVRDQADFDGPLVNYGTKGHQVEYVGDERLDGRLVRRLRVTKKSGRVLDYLIDAETNLEVMTVATASQGGASVTVETVLEDYRSIDGVMVPFRVRALVDGRLASEITVGRVELDVKVDGARFRASPAASPDTPGSR